jgi:hypothetical protein
MKSSIRYKGEVYTASPSISMGDPRILDIYNKLKAAYRALHRDISAAQVWSDLATLARLCPDCITSMGGLTGKDLVDAFRLGTKTTHILKSPGRIDPKRLKVVPVSASSKYGAKILVADLQKMIEHIKSFLMETKSSSNPQLVLQRAKHEARLELLEALVNDSLWKVYRSTFQ